MGLSKWPYLLMTMPSVTGTGRALSAARARCCLTPAGLCIIPAEGLPVSLHLSEEDLLDEPVPLTSGLLWLRTKPLGWPLGKTATVTWNGEETTGLVVERSLDADTLSGVK